MNPRRRQTQTRISARQSLLEKKAPHFAAPPVIQPKLQRKTETELPEWKPDSSRQSSPLERLRHSGTLQAKPELRGSQAIVQRTLEQVESRLGEGKTIGGLEAFCRTIEFSPENVGFLRACRVWQGLGRGANLAAQTRIYNKYIVGSQTINISSSQRIEIINRHRQSVASGVPDVTIFDNAEKEITSLLTSNVVPRYNKQAEDTKVG